MLKGNVEIQIIRTTTTSLGLHTPEVVLNGPEVIASQCVSVLVFFSHLFLIA